MIFYQLPLSFRAEEVSSAPQESLVPVAEQYVQHHQLFQLFFLSFSISLLDVCFFSQGPRGDKGNRGEIVSFLVLLVLLSVFLLFVFLTENVFMVSPCRDYKDQGYVFIVYHPPFCVSLRIFNYTEAHPACCPSPSGISWPTWTPWTSSRFSTFIFFSCVSRS